MSYIYPIGGGKGGSGKSFITANLGVLFSKLGKRVVLIDLDLGGANLHTFLGLKNLKTGLNEFLNKRVESLNDAAVSTPVPNLSIISSINCSMEIANLFHLQKLRIVRSIKKLPYDYILLDLGAGTNFNTLDFFLTSNDGVFIITPEPTSIENTFRFIKAVYFRKIKQILKEEAFKSVVREVIDKSKNGILNWPFDIIEIMREQDPDKAKLLQDKLGEYGFMFVLNQFRKQSDRTLGNKIQKVCNKHFYSKFQFLGNVTYDERVHDSIFTQKIFMRTYPYTLTATDLKEIAEKIAEMGRDAAALASGAL
jgi:flagellar biosynthesis protein FlhG